MRIRVYSWTKSNYPRDSCVYVEDKIREDSCLSVDRKYYGVPAIAVGLSAVSFLATLAKDAASIPNAGGAAETSGGPYIN